MYEKLEIEFAGRKLSLETGRLAKQAHGSVLATYGDTVVLATAVSQYEARPNVGFSSTHRRLRRKDISPPEKFPADFLSAKDAHPRKKFSPRA